MKDKLILFCIGMMLVAAVTVGAGGKKKVYDEGICGPARFDTQPMRDLCLQVQTLGSEVAKLRSNQFNFKNPQPVRSRGESLPEEGIGPGTFGPPIPEELPEEPEDEQ